MTKHSQLKKSCDQLQLGWVQATFMITMHFIHPWADRQLQIQRHSAGPAHYNSVSTRSLLFSFT